MVESKWRTSSKFGCDRICQSESTSRYVLSENLTFLGLKDGNKGISDDDCISRVWSRSVSNNVFTGDAFNL